MRNTHSVGKQIAVFATAAVCCIAGLESAALAQGGRGKTYPVDRRIEAMNRQAGEYERDGLHRNLEEEAADRKLKQSQ